MPKYAEMVYNGFWFSPEREALQALVDSTQQYVTGTVSGVGAGWCALVCSACVCFCVCLCALLVCALEHVLLEHQPQPQPNPTQTQAQPKPHSQPKPQPQPNQQVRVKLYKGNTIVVGRKSPFSLYDPIIASFEDDQVGWGWGGVGSLMGWGCWEGVWWEDLCAGSVEGC